MTDEELIRTVLKEHQQTELGGDYWCKKCDLMMTTPEGCEMYRVASAALRAWEQGIETGRDWSANGVWNHLPENPYRKDKND